MKKLAIVCGSPSSEMSAPFHDEAYDVWVLGNRCNRYPRFDLIFEIHDDLAEHGPKYPEWLLSHGKQLVVGEGFPLVHPDVTAFPFAEAAALFGSTYLTSSSAYMLALALLRGYEHVELYGVDMAIDDHEYFRQRPCMEAWIGFARGRGVTVVIPAQSPLAKSDFVEGRGCGGKPDFSLPPFTQKEFQTIAGQHAAKVADAQRQIAELEKVVIGHDAARQVYERLAKVSRAVEAGQTIKTLTETVVIR